MKGVSIIQIFKIFARKHIYLYFWITVWITFLNLDLVSEKEVKLQSKTLTG